jgi:peptidoglycan hydrolase-like protein with peptidoglycan-binding domain
MERVSGSGSPWTGGNELELDTLDPAPAPGPSPPSGADGADGVAPAPDFATGASSDPFAGSSPASTSGNTASSDVPSSVLFAQIAARGALAGARALGAIAAGGAAGAATPKSYPLAGDPVLDDVARGGSEIGKGAKGSSVEKLQTALEIAGYKLPRYGHDGDFGDETRAAVIKLQRDSGLPPTGKVDAQTLAALETRSAAKLQFPEYDELFKDGVLDTTIAVGYDEGDSHREQIKKVKDNLAGQGYTQLDVRTATPRQLQAHGIDPATVDKDVLYYVKSFKHEGRDVNAVVKLITPGTPDAKAHFAKAMASSEVVIYSGHGRVGSGPDFDDKHDPAGNFVIGKPYKRNYVDLGENDLKKTPMTNDYQMMFFDGCNTNLYLDDLRRVPRNKDTSNLDIVGASTELPWSTSADDVGSFLDGITHGKSINEIKHDLDVINREGPRDRKKHFLSDGFQDNHP